MFFMHGIRLETEWTQNEYQPRTPEKIQTGVEDPRGPLPPGPGQSLFRLSIIVYITDLDEQVPTGVNSGASPTRQCYRR